jgi:hypothetical protein
VEGHSRQRAGSNQQDPTIQIYIIGNDGIMLRRKPPSSVGKGEIAVASIEEL